MVDIFENLGLHSYEQLDIKPGELLVTKDDVEILVPNEIVLIPGRRCTFKLVIPDKYKYLASGSSVHLNIRSGLAQSGIDIASTFITPQSAEVTLVNRHPINQYKFTSGPFAIGRLYKYGEPLSGLGLNELMKRFRTGPYQPDLAEDGKTIQVPVVPESQWVQGDWEVKQPIDVRKIPSGLMRRDLAATIGSRLAIDHTLDRDQRMNNRSGFQVWTIDFVEFPPEVCLLITNPNHSSARIADPRFRNLLVAETFGEKIPKVITMQAFKQQVL